jgi:hypothetical protein
MPYLEVDVTCKFNSVHLHLCIWKVESKLRVFAEVERNLICVQVGVSRKALVAIMYSITDNCPKLLISVPSVIPNPNRQELGY